MIRVILLGYNFLGPNMQCFRCLRNFLHMLKLNFISVKKICPDSGGEYMFHEFQEYIQQKGILSQRSWSNTSQQNRMWESPFAWCNAHLTSSRFCTIPSLGRGHVHNYILFINRLPSMVIDFKSLFFGLFKTQSYYNDLHTFLCVCFVHLIEFKRHELRAQSIQCPFMGYSHSHIGVTKLATRPAPPCIKSAKKIVGRASPPSEIGLKI